MLPFIPRKVARKTAIFTSTSSSKPLTAQHASASSSAHASTHQHPTHPVGKRKATETPEDLTALLLLAFSEHSLWVNMDLRRLVTEAQYGWIPLTYLTQNTAYFLQTRSKPTEAALVRAIRAHATDVFEVRLLVSAPSKGVWYGKHSSSAEEIGGYEIRRKDWSDTLARVRNSTRNEWEARTVYVEGTPLAHRSIPGVYRFVTSLLDCPVSQSIQSITLPPHHLDRPGDTPKCKGFALVTFADMTYATRIVADWPWLLRRTSPAQVSPAEANDAVKVGFRTITKVRWEELKEEYLAYRQKLLDEMADTHGDNNEHGNGEEVANTDATPAQPSLDPSAPFPPGCLVFVRHVHPETNKTTLKALLSSHAFGSENVSEALDYVDYNKGMDSCHLRLSTPSHAQKLAAAFHDRPIVHQRGLDTAGSPPSPSESPDRANLKTVSAKVLDGAREALYWDKVPERVRRSAVRRAIAEMAGSNCAAVDPALDGAREQGAESERHGRRARKRRRMA